MPIQISVGLTEENTQFQLLQFIVTQYFFFCCLSEQSVSAFAPICNPIQCQWGKKALGGYLGPDTSKWEVCVAAAVL